jgi:hypothetical protein
MIFAELATNGQWKLCRSWTTTAPTDVRRGVPELVGKGAASILPDVPVRTWDSIVFRLGALLLALRATA